MVEKITPAETEYVTCAVCLKEIPASVAMSQEGDEYTQHFCGLECYSKWKQQRAEEPEPEGNDKG